MNILH